MGDFVSYNDELLKEKRQVYLQQRLYLYNSISQSIHELSIKLHQVNKNFDQLNRTAEDIDKYSKNWLQFHDESSSARSVI